MDATVNAGACSSSNGTGLNFLDLPDCMIEQVLEYLSYDEIAKKRIVCRKFDRICQSMLNRGFIKMIRRHNTNLKAIKSQLPRRESERRNHPLAKHSDILTCIETRISMLSMTYSKFIDKELCCFIPGKVIDEVLHILELIENTSRPLRAHEVLQELRDISSMAIEHFDENIAQRLKKIIGVQHQPTPSAHLAFPVVGFTQNEVLLPCDVSESFIMPTLAPISTNPPTSSSLATSSNDHSRGPLVGGLYSGSACSESRVNNASIARLSNKSRKMRCDISQMNHAIGSVKAEMRSMRLLVVRHTAEIKELRRRLEESEAKNLELLANINQLGFGAPSVGSSSGATSASGGLLKRLYPVDTEESHTAISPAVPSSPHSDPSAVSSDEGDGEEETGRSNETGASTAKKIRFRE